MNKKVSNIGSIIILCAGILIAILKPVSAIDAQGNLILAGIIITLGIWIFKPFDLPFSAGAMFFAAYMLIVGVSASTVFSGFTQSAIWTLVGALFFGFALNKTGLGYRLALMIFKLFKLSYFTIMLAWVIIGIVLSVLTPSMTVRVAIVMPIAVSCCEICGLEKGSKGNSLIMLTAFSMALIPGGAWLTGSLTGPVLQGAYESVDALQGVLTFDSWLGVSLLPIGIAVILMLAGAYFILKPKEKLPAKATKAVREIKIDKISKDEIVTGCILVVSFVLFFTGNSTGISSTAVCLGATFLFFCFGIVKAKDIGTGISWDLVVFLGVALGLGNVCEEAGIIDWLADLIVPALGSIAGNPYLFVGIFTLFCFVWHFVDVASYFPTVAILTPIIPAICTAYDMSPLIFAPILTTATCAFFLRYQNHWVIMAEDVAGERSWTAKHLLIYGIIYCLSSVIGMMASVPYWQANGWMF